MDPSACRVIYIDERFNTERWISRDGIGPASYDKRKSSSADFDELPPDLQANVNAFLSVFNQGMFHRFANSVLVTNFPKSMSVVRAGRFLLSLPKYTKRCPVTALQS